jgi:cob(I)alamin adenosyltransferase
MFTIVYLLYSNYMAFEDYELKKSVTVVFTGDSKGKTSASLGLMCRALGRGHKVAYIQFIKHWEVGEHTFIHKIEPLFKNSLYFYKGGQGFYAAGELSEKNISDAMHKKAAQETYDIALDHATSGKYNLIICDEISNAVHDGLLTETQLKKLMTSKEESTSLCITGRDFPERLIPIVDIATNMTKLKHHFDDKYLANKGIDY